MRTQNKPGLAVVLRDLYHCVGGGGGSGVAKGGARGARAPPLAPGSVYIYVELTFRNV